MHVWGECQCGLDQAVTAHTALFPSDIFYVLVLFLLYFYCLLTLDALAVHSHFACVAPCSSGAVRINYHFMNESALNHLGVSAEPMYSSVVTDRMI